MKKLITILFVCLLPFYLKAQTADAGADHSIYLTDGNSTTIGGISSGTSYLWTKIYDVQQPQAGYPIDPATIVSPTSAITSVTGMIQGIWYYQLAVTTGATTKKDTVVIRVDVQPPPDNYILERYLPLNNNMFDTSINSRTDTTQFADDKAGTTYTQGSILLNRSRYNSMMVDSSRGKLYTTVEDGYYWPFSVANPGVHGKYSRAEVFNSSSYIADTTKTYIYEWKGYFPQSIPSNLPLLDPQNAGVFSRILTIMQMHCNCSGSGPWQFGLTHDSLHFRELNDISGSDYNGAAAIVNLFSTSDANLLNKTHTYRVETRQGYGYPGQDAYIKVYVDGNMVYQRDTGNVGQTKQRDYIKYSSIYDYRNTITNPDSLSRGKKFSLVTEAMNIYVKAFPVVNAGSIVNTNSSSIILGGSVEKNPDKTVTYLWTKISGSGTQSIINNTTITPTVTGLTSGSYVFRLTASQSDWKSNYSDVTVNVIQGNNIILKGKWEFKNK